MFCEKCGEKISDNTVYCKYCGTRTSNEPVVTTPSLAPTVTTTNSIQSNPTISYKNVNQNMSIHEYYSNYCLEATRTSFEQSSKFLMIMYAIMAVIILCLSSLLDNMSMVIEPIGAMIFTYIIHKTKNVYCAYAFCGYAVVLAILALDALSNGATVGIMTFYIIITIIRYATAAININKSYKAFINGSNPTQQQ